MPLTDFDEENSMGGLDASYEDIEASSSASPLSRLMTSRAKNLSPRREEIVGRRDALLEAYKKLIQAQQHRKLPVNDASGWLSGAAGLMESQDPNMRAFGASNLARAKTMMQEQQLEQQALKDQATSMLQMQAADLGFLDKDQADEFDLLKQAGATDYQNQAMQMKMMLAAMKNSGGNLGASASAETAASMGVPTYKGPNPYEGLDKTGQRQLRMNYEDQIKKEQDAAQEQMPAVDRMKRFEQLNEAEKDNLLGTGPVADWVPNWSDNMKEMESIASEIIPQMRVIGSGASSDKDMATFAKATVGTGKPYEVNKNIARAYVVSKENAIQKPDFMEAYLTANGHLRGSTQAWKKYLNDNPIFDVSTTNPKKDKYVLNEKRKTWQEYFGADIEPPAPTESENQPEASTEITKLPPAPPGYDATRWEKIYSKMTPEQQKLFMAPPQ